MNPPDNNPISVVICDDDELSCQALNLLLQGPGIELLATCETADGCLQEIACRPPQVAIVDLLMDGNRRAGIDLIRRIRALSPATICLVLTAIERSGELLPDAFMAGAHGFLRKGYLSGIDLPVINKRLAEGHWEIDPELAHLLMGRVITEPQAAPHARGDAHYCLMPTEFSVLRLIASGMATPKIADMLEVSESTVHAYIRNITDKFHLGAGPRIPLCSPAPA